MTDKDQTADDFDAVVAEYVVGVLPLEERRALEARMVRDPVIREHIALWEARLEDLNETYGQMTVPRGVKARIDRQLFKETPRRASPWMWLVWAAAGLAFAALAVAFFVWDAPNAGLRATLAGEDGALVVALDLQGSALDITQTATQPPDGSVFELWVVRPDQPPQSLGTFSAAGTLQVQTALADGETLAISIEPLGGSPSGTPTGPIIATGTLQDA